jgi:hypothetical protein
VERLGPGVLDHRHRLDEGRRVGRAVLVGIRTKDHLGGGSAAEIGPLLLHVRRCEPLHIEQRVVDVLRRGNDGRALAAKLRELSDSTGGILEEADLVAADRGDVQSEQG